MTTKKLNSVKRICWLSVYPNTFNSVLAAAEDKLGSMLDTMTAAQIAAVLELCYLQYSEGQFKGFCDYR